jgi:CubicO group peptidase (beta-lactamase class C family)
MPLRVWLLRRLSPLLPLLAPACTTPAAPPRAPQGAAPTARVFAPGRTDPARRAKLLSLAPQLDDYYRAKLAEARATGAIVGIVLDGELVYAQGFGVRDVESQAPIDADTVFRVGSLTKGFTAAAVLKLRDEGRLVLDAPAALYLPELEPTRGLTRDAGAITLRQLLTMTSGLPHDDMWGAVSFGYSSEQLTGLLKAGLQLASAPGETYAYSNLGYALLGKIARERGRVEPRARYRARATERSEHDGQSAPRALGRSAVSECLRRAESAVFVVGELGGGFREVEARARPL